MSVQKAYDSWSVQYDTNINKTRDLEALALREILAGIEFESCLEIGCGTGKNTEWLLTKASALTAVDLSAEMLAKAKEKISSDKVNFLQADILQNWDFANTKYDLLSFSLVLEHIEHLDPVFEKAAKVIADGGYIYIGELHPFKQYGGSKARFDTEEGVQVVSCFNHHVSDFTQAAAKHGFNIILINEFFDDEDRNTVPRILAMLFQAKNSTALKV
ncbi:MAG: class I SAM-dependent methyltransferase [Ferruginibacter sp.]|nr:class I SAM-dependent methyltransferase [Ferruginibacter sp.]